MTNLTHLRELANAAEAAQYGDTGTEFGAQLFPWWEADKLREYGHQEPDASYIAALNPAALIELLDRLEAAERDAADLRAAINQTVAEFDAIKAKEASRG